MKEENPYSWWTIHHWLWYIHQPSNKAHRMFWDWGKESDPGIWAIYGVGAITLWWYEGSGWSWSWNFD